MSRLSPFGALCVRAAVIFMVPFTIWSQSGVPQSAVDRQSEDLQMDHSQMDHSQMDHASIPGMMMMMNSAENFFMTESSGTDFQPSAWPMPMLMTETGDWHLMWMAQAFIVDTQQSGPRGGDKFYSTNWGMLSATHKVGRGAIMLRSMLSLEPATIADRRYPLLFQTGETAFGKPIIDGQHPHNLFMEIAIQYAHPLGEHGTWDLYYAPVGDPALGPVAYPHRASASEFPQAALGHHWEDSTHISYNVATAGITYEKLRLEASGFHGAEPTENRWTLAYGAIDSWSARLSALPSPNWAAQVSVGRLNKPEALESGDTVRTTASVEYIRPRSDKTSWATSLIWGQDHQTARHDSINAITAETVFPFARRNFLTGRFEWSQRNELIADDPSHSAFDVTAYTVGYTRDIASFRDLEAGLGANVSAYQIGETLQQLYGAKPWGVNVFLRLRLKKG